MEIGGPAACTSLGPSVLGDDGAAVAAAARAPLELSLLRGRSRSRSRSQRSARPAPLIGRLDELGGSALKLAGDVLVEKRGQVGCSAASGDVAKGPAYGAAEERDSTPETCTGNCSTEEETASASAREEFGLTGEPEDAKAECLQLSLADDTTLPTCTPDTGPGTGNTEDESLSTTTYPDGALGPLSGGPARAGSLALAAASLAARVAPAPASPGRPQFTKQINRTGLLFVSVPKTQAHLFPQGRRVMFLPPGAGPELGTHIRVTRRAKHPGGTKFLCRGWAELVRMHAIAIGDIVHFVLSRDDPLKWEFTVARVNQWASSGKSGTDQLDVGHRTDGSRGELRCMRCGRNDSEERLLRCDGLGCGRACHLECCWPPLSRVPEGPWLCSYCENASVDTDAFCMFCGKRDRAASMLLCPCGRSSHPSCCRPPLHEVPSGEWLCELCRMRACMVCGKRNDSAKFLLCDGPLCGRSCHLWCCEPKMSEVPAGEWLCMLCRRSRKVPCMVCGEHGDEATVVLCQAKGCGRACHLRCCQPPLREAPAGDWRCTLCQSGDSSSSSSSSSCGDASCMACGRKDDEANMLLCDGSGCSRACHLQCCTPPLREVPRGKWFCTHCRGKSGKGGRQVDVSCAVCGRCDNEAELLLCDGLGCDRACHLACCSPPLLRVPVGEWYCDHCQNQDIISIVYRPPPAASSGCFRPAPKRKCGRSPSPEAVNEGGKRCVAFGEALRAAYRAAASRPARHASLSPRTSLPRGQGRFRRRCA